MARNGQAGSKISTTYPGQFGSPAVGPPSVLPQKRKGNAQVKYYAVKAGHTPGVYLTWKECEQNISGFKGAAFKSFLTREEANAYVAGRAISSKSALGSSEVEKFYGVAKGRNPGVYTEWATAQEQITGWKFPKYKKFATRAEATEFVRSGGNAGADKSQLKSSEDLRGNIVEDGTSEPRPSKRAKTAASGRDYDYLEDDMMSEFDILDPVGPIESKNSSTKQVLRIHTDGSSLNNGKSGARAGLGVYFGPGDPRNVAERLPGMPQTNQRAELAAIQRALELAPAEYAVRIVTDSQYSIKCVTLWHRNWERNDWQTSTQQPVLNRDLIQGVLAQIRAREARGAATTFEWVKGHSSDEGNEAADRLAVLGAQKPSL